jgi:hypothetical protein
LDRLVNRAQATDETAAGSTEQAISVEVPGATGSAEGAKTQE